MCLTRPALILMLPGSAGDELDQAVVEERRPHLDGMRHGQAVDEGQHLVGQQGLEVEEKRAVERIGDRCRPPACRG